MYRLGAHVTFRGEIKCLSIVDLDDGQLTRLDEKKEFFRKARKKPPQLEFQSGLLLPDGLREIERVSLPLEEIEGVGRTAKFDLGPFFLASTGDARVHSDLRGRPDNDLFAFHVHEPGLAIVNWLIAVVAGLVGAGAATLIQYLLENGDAMPPP